MRLEQSQFEPPQFGEHDQPIERALDRLGELVAPTAAGESDFVAHVMKGISDAPSPRRVNHARRFMRLATAGAVCAIAVMVFWRPADADKRGNENIATNANNGTQTPTAEPNKLPAVRTSTWSTVTEAVVLERDVPVRKLLYREFERVELFDANGNTDGEMVVPTKVMLLATKERY